MLRAGFAVVLVCVAASTSLAQAPKSIDPGMSEAKVVERLGQPDGSRTSGDYKYLFYKNECIKQCGMPDIVTLQKDSVVDAVFRSADRAYTGKSSSPRSIPAEVAARTRPGARVVPSGEVVQAGAPLVDTASKHEAKPDSVSSAPPKPEPKHTHKATTKSAATEADSTHHDTISGTLRIPVKPQHHSMKSDSTPPDTATKRPH